MKEGCNICPFNCNANRKNNELGFCKIGGKIKISHVTKHMWEEPCISGNNGSAAIFFTGCNLRCVFCQNHKISRQESEGKEITEEELAMLFISKQEEGMHNINLVSPTPYIDYIAKAIRIAKERGLKIPIVYNSNGYENVESLKKLDGMIDVYLPDFKYADDKLAKKYSSAINYTENAISAIKEMYRQVGNAKFDKNGMIIKGVIVRHLILPNNLENTKKVLDKLKKEIDDNIYISLMSQYIPKAEAYKYKEINRRITEEEYNEIIDYFFDIGLKNGFMQELDSADENYIPNF